MLKGKGIVSWFDSRHPLKSKVLNFLINNIHSRIRLAKVVCG